MNKATGWFEVSKEGLAQILERKGRSFAVLELLQNSWDQTTKVVTCELRTTGKGLARLIVEDDDEKGFLNMSDAWTLFAASNKKVDPTKRGRFNLGEKLVLSMCKEATIASTKGMVTFNESGKRTFDTKTQRAAGSRFEGLLRIRKSDVEEIEQTIWTLIPPSGVTTTYNGKEIPHRTPVKTLSLTLPTEVADEEGRLKRTARKTNVEVYEVLAGEMGAIYEMGIPVVETGDKWHYNVCVGPNTRILTADLQYVAANTITPGTALLGFDETRSGTRRSFRASKVEAVAVIRMPSYRLTFDDGTVVVCSEDHQWLTSKGRAMNGVRKGRVSKWTATRNLVVKGGRRAGSAVVKPLDVWETDNSRLSGYLASAFDGEGCFHQSKASRPDGVRNVLTFSQRHNSMLTSVRTLLEADGFHPTAWTEKRSVKNPNWHDITTLSLGHREEALRFLGRHRPMRLLNELRLELLGTMPTKRAVRLMKKELIGEQEVVAIRTSTKTYIAEGLASHNCQKVPLGLERDNVSPSYLRTIRTFVYNEMYPNTGVDDANGRWGRDALSDERITDEAVRYAVTQRFGDKAVIFDMSDTEANKIAVSSGHTLIYGSMLHKEEWVNVKRAGFLLPAGKVTPSSKPTPEELGMKEMEHTPGMQEIIAYTHRAARAILGHDIVVRVIDHRGANYLAKYGGGYFTYNAATLGHGFFNHGISVPVDSLIIHEFGHDSVGDHLSAEYYRILTDLGAKLKAWAVKEALAQN